MNRLDLTVSAEHAGERLDKFLSDSVEGLSRSSLTKLIEDGKVTVGEKGPDLFLESEAYHVQNPLIDS